MDHIYQQIDGWFDWQDTYRRWAAQVTDRGRIVEVGCYQGKSLAYLLVELANRGRTDVRVSAVDNFVGETPLAGDLLEQQFKRNMRGFENLELLNMRSVEAANQFLDLTLDFVWLDGDHSFGAVLEDMEVWWPKLRLGGEMGGHDLAWSTVGDAVRLWCKARGVQFEVLPSSVPSESQMCSWLIRK